MNDTITAAGGLCTAAPACGQWSINAPPDPLYAAAVTLLTAGGPAVAAGRLAELRCIAQRAEHDCAVAHG